MIKSKSMAAAAAALAMCMAGSAFAQDHRFDRGPDRNDLAQPGYRADARADYRPGPDYRPDARSAYRPGPDRFDHRADPNPYAEWRRGGRMPSEYRGRQYVVNDWRGHRLAPPPRGYQWTGVGGDFVLAAVATGLIAQIIVGQ
jgi:Ni/Co efflux regulator RcnB